MSSREMRQVALAALCSDQTAEELEHWSALVRGGWSLVDQFDQEGKRYLIAEQRPGQALISPVDWEMLTARARGLALKVIAAEVGLSVSAVSRRLRHSMQKLGLRTQCELARLLVQTSAEVRAER